MSEEMMAKNAKITARKQLYHALSIMFDRCVKDMLEVSKAAQVIADHGEEMQEKMGMEIPPELLREILVRQLSAIRPIYAVSCALKSYKEAFSEFPEFTKFMSENGKEKTLEDLVNSGSKLLDSAEQKMRKAGLLKPGAPPLKSTVFGEDYFKIAERVKVKGE
jgi:hypothetical protein